MIKSVNRAISRYEKRISAFPAAATAHWAPNLRSCALSTALSEASALIESHFTARNRGEAKARRKEALTERIRESPEWQKIQQRLLKMGAIVVRNKS